MRTSQLFVKIFENYGVYALRTEKEGGVEAAQTFCGQGDQFSERFHIV